MPPAVASNPAAIAGKWRLTATPQNYDAGPAQFVWKITPRCELEPCTSDAYSFTTNRRWVLRWDTEGVYHASKDSAVGSGKCYRSDTGQVVARKAWFISTSYSLWVSSAKSGRARWMRGTRTTTWEPTGRARAEGCRRITEFDQISAKRIRG